MKESFFEGAGGLKILTRAWRPAAEKPRGVVVIVPGFNSHSGRYAWVADQLVAQNLAVYSLDLRGRGKSDGERYYVKAFEDYVGDVSSMVDIAKSSESGLPVFLLGHSAGGVVSCLYAAEHQSRLAGLICESFAYEVPAPSFALATLKGLSHIAPHAHVLKLHNKDFSRDPQVVASMDDDSLDRARGGADANHRGDGAGRRAAQERVSADHVARPHHPRNGRQGGEAEREPALLRERRTRRIRR